MNLHKPYTQRLSYFIANALLLIAALLICLCLNSCNTFEKAFRKYGTNKTDTTYQDVRLTVPRDSVALQIITDTTTVYKEVRQGRARIIYQRNPNTTIIKADCDSVIVEKKVPKYITKQVWGVDPEFKKDAERRLTIIYVLAGLIGLGVIVYLFSHQFQISRRSKPVINENHPS